MNSIKNFGLKFTLMLIAFFSVNYASAQFYGVELNIPTKVVTDYDEFQLEIALKNFDVDVPALQFTIKLGENLEWANGENTEPQLTSRIVRGQKVNMKINDDNVATVMVRPSSENDVIAAGEGDIMTIPLKVKKPTPDPETGKYPEDNVENGAHLDVTLTEITYTNFEGTDKYKPYSNVVGTVIFEPFSYKGYLTPDPVTIYPSKTQTLSFCLDNIMTVDESREAPVLGLTFYVKLPEGLQITEESLKDLAINSDRVFNRASAQGSSRGDGLYFFMLSDDMSNQPLKSGINTGALFSFVVEADETFAGDAAEIVLSNLEISAIDDTEVIIGECVNSPVVNGASVNQAACDAVLARLDALKAEYETALAELQETYTGVDLTEWEEMIGGQIEEQKKGAEQALAAANEDAAEFNYPFDDGEYILAMIEEMKNYAAETSAAQAALEAANAEACNEVLASLDALQAEYEAAVAEIRESNPEFEIAEWEEIIMGAINQARDGAVQALASANEDSVEFSYAYGEEDIQAMIQEMINSAESTAVNAIEAAVASGKASIFTLDGKKHDRLVSGEVNVIVRENSTSKIFIK